MSLVADALQPLLLAGLLKIERRPESFTLADVVGGRSRAGYDLDFEEHNKTIVIDFREPSVVLNAVAFDISRFASASFQSIKQACSDLSDKERVAWGLIKAYYAAFYAGHAIIRILGESCSQLNRTHINTIMALASATGKTPNFHLAASVYRCLLSQSATVIRSSSLREGSGGVHEAFWNVFGLRVGSVNEAILLGPLGQLDKQSVFDKLETMRQSIRANKAPFFNWLSVVRNDVQYRHGHKVWLPNTPKKDACNQLGRLAGQWKRDPMEVDLGASRLGTLGHFATTCAFIVSVCRSLLSRIAERSPVPTRSFASFGPLALLKAEEVRARTPA